MSKTKILEILIPAASYGALLDVIQAGLGHSSLETTRKIYASSPNMSPMADAIRQTSKKKRQDF